jgi:hypothetical protein
MKAKLLKKIKERFGWYITKQGSFVLVDYLSKKYFLIDDDYALAHNNVKTIEELDLKITLEEYKFRLMKKIMLSAFGYSHKDVRFNYAARVSKQCKKRRI